MGPPPPWHERQVVSGAVRFDRSGPSSNRFALSARSDSSCREIDAVIFANERWVLDVRTTPICEPVAAARSDRYLFGALGAGGCSDELERAEFFSRARQTERLGSD